MALEKIPADIRATGGVARMSDPKIIKEIMEAVTIPVSVLFPFPSLPFPSHF
jgi:pyridoxal 5'-phosphate synthase pdxS subunit